MYGDRNIQLGCGLQSVTCQGTNVIVLPELRKGVFLKDERFDCRAILCESREELQKEFTREVSLNINAGGAELSGNASVSRSIGSNNFDSFYMLVIECIEGRREIDLWSSSQQILLPDVKREIATLRTVEHWEAFYRTKGDRLVCSIVEGSKHLIIVTLNNKVKNKEFIGLLQTKLTTPMMSSSSAGVAAKLHEQLTLLGQENISSVEMHSLGDSNPDFLRLIGQLGSMKIKLAQFVNASHAVDSRIPEAAVSDTYAENRVVSKGKGKILAFTSCSYIDFLPDGIRSEVEQAYDQFLQRTNRAAHYISAISKTHMRCISISNDIDYFLQGHYGAFVYDHETEVAGFACKEILSIYKDTLVSLYDQIVAEISGLNPDHKLRQKKSLEAQAYLKLKKDISTLYQSAYFRDFHPVVVEQLQLIEQFIPLVRENDRQYLLPLKKNYAAIVDIFQAYRDIERETLHQLHQLGLKVHDFFLQVSQKQELMAIDNLVVFYKAQFMDPLGKRTNPSVPVMSTKKQEFLVDQSLYLLKVVIDNVESSTEKGLSIDLSSFKHIFEQLKRVKFTPATADTRNSMTYLPHDPNEVGELITLLGVIIEPWVELLSKIPVLSASLLTESGQRYSKSVEAKFREVSSILSLGLRLFTIETFSEFKIQSTLLYSEWLKKHADFMQVLAEKVEACHLGKKELIQIEQICQHYLDDQLDAKVIEKRWEDVWYAVNSIAHNLDFIVMNKVPLDLSPWQADMFKKIFAVIDFKNEAFRVGVFEAVRHKLWRTEMFSGKKFTKLSVPIGATSLRLQLTGDLKLPAEQLVFDIERGSPIQMDDRHVKHRILHRGIALGGPIIPQKLAREHVLSIAGRFTSNKVLLRMLKMLHASNEETVYRKVRVKNAHFPLPVGSDIISLEFSVFAQMGHLGKGLECLGLPKEPPVGHADYGFHFRLNATSEEHQYMRAPMRDPGYSGRDSSKEPDRARPSSTNFFHCDDKKTIHHVYEQHTSEDILARSTPCVVESVVNPKALVQQDLFQSSSI